MPPLEAVEAAARALHRLAHGADPEPPAPVATAKAGHDESTIEPAGIKLTAPSREPALSLRAPASASRPNAPRASENPGRRRRVRGGRGARRRRSSGRTVRRGTASAPG